MLVDDGILELEFFENWIDGWDEGWNWWVIILESLGLVIESLNWFLSKL